eukprot:GHRR01032678.1.p1 GENE.GHRR01032678.1~~GHRR01032678.1.p1  ORF type:complete len:103 (+),score=6.08 GHRR01032678.1:297-605(+)
MQLCPSSFSCCPSPRAQSAGQHLSVSCPPAQHHQDPPDLIWPPSTHDYLACTRQITACHGLVCLSTTAGDLANMDALDPESASKLPALMALRDAIYSQEFRG